MTVSSAQSVSKNDAFILAYLSQMSLRVPFNEPAHDLMIHLANKVHPAIAASPAVPKMASLSPAAQALYERLQKAVETELETAATEILGKS